MIESTKKGWAAAAGLLLMAAAACNSPAKPSGAATVTVPGPLSPANGAQIANAAQPVTLAVSDATVTGGSGATLYTFEVATDAGFVTIVASKDIPETPGQTSTTLNPLTGGKDYFWHVRTTSGDTVGAFTNPLKFTIGPAVTVQAPVVASPAPGATGVVKRPTLTVTNAAHTGPTGAITYKFDVSASSSFATILTSGTVPEGSGQTSFSLSIDLNPNTQYSWRVQAVDTGSNVASPFSSASFTTASANPLFPGAVPPGTPGHAVLGDNWQQQVLVSHGGTLFNSPPLECQQLFALMDLGFDPQGAIDWMHANGYFTDAEWFPGPQVIGVQFVYMALINGRWDLILRGEGE